MFLGITTRPNYNQFFDVIFQVFGAPLRSELLNVNPFLKALQKLAKTKHYVGIIKSAVFLNSFSFLWTQNHLKIKEEFSKNQTKIEQKPNETEGDLHLVQ